jgi:hypothetical protein
MMKYIRGSVVLIVSFLFAWSAAGCRPQDSGDDPMPPSPTSVTEPSLTITPIPTAAIPISTLPHSTPTLSPLSPTSTPVEVVTECVPFQPLEALPPTAYHVMPEAVLDFLNRGGTLEALDEGLYNSGIANQPVAAASGDLTGNGKQDVVISVYNPVSPSIPPAGQLVIYTCQNGAYELAFSQVSPEFAGAPGIRFVEDLTGDGVNELVTSSPACGAHTCLEQLEVLKWDGEEFINRLVGDTTDLPFPVIELQEQEEGVYDLVVFGSGVGSAGAGPQRDIIRRWSYQPETSYWVVAKEKLGVSDYRIHVLHDADQAVEAQNLDQALLLYQRVISDTTLVDWINPEREKEILSAYARFRLVVLYSIRGQDQFSQMILQEMEQAYPPRSPLFAYAQMAMNFKDVYTSKGLEAACGEVRDYARENDADVLAPLGPDTFGYGNPSYTPEDICPW